MAFDTEVRLFVAKWLVLHPEDAELPHEPHGGLQRT